MSKSGVNLTYAGLPWRTRVMIRLRDRIFETAWRHGTVVLSRELYERSHHNRDLRELSLRSQLLGLHGRHKELREQLHKANLRRMELEGVLLQVSDLLRDAGMFPRIKSILRGSATKATQTRAKDEEAALDVA